MNILEELEDTVQELTHSLKDTQAELRVTQARQTRAERRARAATLLACAAVGATLLLNVRPGALAQTPGVSLAMLLMRLTNDESAIKSLQTVTSPLTLAGTPGTYPATLTITGVNVQIVNGTGATNGEPMNPTDITKPVTNGLGNLIIGYNQTGNPAGDKRMGSHDLILGDYNNYQSYGGIVAGQFCSASGPFSAVTGGAANYANSAFASVTGGSGNSASGLGATVSGGNSVQINGGNAWAAGGAYGTTPGPGTFHSP